MPSMESDIKMMLSAQMKWLTMRFSLTPEATKLKPMPRAAQDVRARERQHSQTIPKTTTTNHPQHHPQEGRGGGEEAGGGEIIKSSGVLRSMKHMLQDI